MACIFQTDLLYPRKCSCLPMAYIHAILQPLFHKVPWLSVSLRTAPLVFKPCVEGHIWISVVWVIISLVIGMCCLLLLWLKIVSQVLWGNASADVVAGFSSVDSGKFLWHTASILAFFRFLPSINILIFSSTLTRASGWGCSSVLAKQAEGVIGNTWLTP